jgi:hypothetical protein
MITSLHVRNPYNVPWAFMNTLSCLQTQRINSCSRPKPDLARNFLTSPNISTFFVKPECKMEDSLTSYSLATRFITRIKIISILGCFEEKNTGLRYPPSYARVFAPLNDF